MWLTLHEKKMSKYAQVGIANTLNHKNKIENMFSYYIEIY